MERTGDALRFRVACVRQAEPGPDRARHDADSERIAAGLGRQARRASQRWCDRSARPLHSPEEAMSPEVPTSQLPDFDSR
jgi:hypothetical protein